MWKISRINNSTHRVIMQHPDGETMAISVPAEHTASSAAKLAYLKLNTDARDVVKTLELESKTAQARLIAEHEKKTRLLYCAMAILIIIAVSLLIRLL